MKSTHSKHWELVFHKILFIEGAPILFICFFLYIFHCLFYVFGLSLFDLFIHVLFICFSLSWVSKTQPNNWNKTEPYYSHFDCRAEGEHLIYHLTPKKLIRTGGPESTKVWADPIIFYFFWHVPRFQELGKDLVLLLRPKSLIALCSTQSEHPRMSSSCVFFAIKPENSCFSSLPFFFVFLLFLL